MNILSQQKYEDLQNDTPFESYDKFSKPQKPPESYQHQFSLDSKGKDSNRHDCLSFSSNSTIHYQFGIEEKKEDIVVPKTDPINQMQSDRQAIQSFERQGANPIKYSGFNKKKNERQKYQSEKIIDITDDKKVKAEKKRNSFLSKEYSNTYAFEEHNKVVLRKTIRALTIKGVVLKDQKEQQLMLEGDEKSDMKDQQIQNDNKFLFATNINELINLEQVSFIFPFTLINSYSFFLNYQIGLT